MLFIRRPQRRCWADAPPDGLARALPRGDTAEGELQNASDASGNSLHELSPHAAHRTPKRMTIYVFADDARRCQSCLWTARMLPHRLCLRQ